MMDWGNAPVFGLRAESIRYTIRPSAYGVVDDGRGQLAVVRTPQGVYLPGGGIEAGETPVDAVVREALEECGLVVRVGDWVARAVQFAYSEPESAQFEKRCTFVDAVVEGARASGIEPDHELVWVTPAMASEIMAHESHRWAIATWSSRSASSR